MKNFGNALLVSVGLIGLLGYGCSEDSDGDGGTGGTSAGGTGGKGGSSGKGGSAGKATGGSAGKSATGGSSGSSGEGGESGSGTSGAPGTGGSTAGGGGQPEGGGGGQGGDTGSGMAIVLTDGMEWEVCETAAATICGTWTWDASEEHFTFEADNGAEGTITIVENGSELRLHRVDTVGTAGLEGTYVGVYMGGDTVSGDATWMWPGGSAAGTFVATW